MYKQIAENKRRTVYIIAGFVLMIAVTVFGRYIYNSAREAYFIAKQFYFSSNILTTAGSTYTYNNWGGASVYEIEFELQSYLINEMVELDYDLGYTLTCSTPDTDKIRLRYKFW